MTEKRPAPRKEALEREYWDHVARHELRLQCCAGCNRYRYPPAPTCPDCGAMAADWRPLSGHGRILAWTVFHRSYFRALPAPYVVVSVQTDEGPLLVGNLIGLTHPTIGLPVRAVFQHIHFEDGTTGSICQWEAAAEHPLSNQGAFA